jgi:acyl dehydratase
MPDLNINDVFTKSFVVSPKVYDGFIAAFNDKNPLHTDKDFAVSKGFKGKVMHGNILNGFVSYFIGECLPIKNVIIHSQQIQYKNPVYLNDEIIFEAYIDDIYESVNAIGFKFTFKNSESKIVAKGQIQIGLLA